MHFESAAVIAAVALPAVLSSVVHKVDNLRVRALDQYGNDVVDVPQVYNSTLPDNTTSTSILTSYSLIVPVSSSIVNSIVSIYGSSSPALAPTSSTVSGISNPSSIPGYSISAGDVSTPPASLTETLTTYTTLTTCPVTNTYVSASFTRLETVLTTSTIVVTSCQGGCSRFTIATPTLTGNVYPNILPSSTPSSNSFLVEPFPTSSLHSQYSTTPTTSSFITYVNVTTVGAVTTSIETPTLSSQATISLSSYAVVVANTSSIVPVYVQPSTSSYVSYSNDTTFAATTVPQSSSAVLPTIENTTSSVPVYGLPSTSSYLIQSQETVLQVTASIGTAARITTGTAASLTGSTVQSPGTNITPSSPVYLQTSATSPVTYSNYTTYLVATSVKTSTGVPTQTTLPSPTPAVLSSLENSTSPVPLYVSSQPSLANSSYPLSSTLPYYVVITASSAPSSAPVLGQYSQYQTLSVLQSSSTSQFGTGASLEYPSFLTVTSSIGTQSTLYYGAPSSATLSAYGQSSSTESNTPRATSYQSYVTVGSSTQVLSSGTSSVSNLLGSATGTVVYTSYSGSMFTTQAPASSQLYGIVSSSSQKLSSGSTLAISPVGSLSGSNIYASSSGQTSAAQGSVPLLPYAAASSSLQVLPSGSTVMPVSMGSPAASSAYISYPSIYPGQSSTVSIGSIAPVTSLSASDIAPPVLGYGSSTITLTRKSDSEAATNSALPSTQPGSGIIGGTPLVSVATSNLIPSGSNIANSVSTSVLVYAVAMTTSAGRSNSAPSYGPVYSSTTITTTFTVLPLPYGVLGSSSVSIAGPQTSSPINAVTLPDAGISSVLVSSVGYGRPSSAPGSSVAIAYYSVPSASTSSSSISSLAQGSYLLTTDIYGSPTALYLGPSATPTIYRGIADAVQGSSIYAGPTATYTPVYTPELLGNAYGGGYVSTPTLYVSSTAGSGTNQIPPGYGFSLLVVGSATATVYASGASYVSTVLATPTASQQLGYIPATRLSTSTGASTASLPSGFPGPGISSTVRASTSRLDAVSPSSVYSGPTTPLTSSAKVAVSTQSSSTSSSSSNSTHNNSPTAIAIFTGDATRENVACSSIIFGLLVLLYAL